MSIAACSDQFFSCSGHPGTDCRDAALGRDATHSFISADQKGKGSRRVWAWLPPPQFPVDGGTSSPIHPGHATKSMNLNVLL